MSEKSRRFGLLVRQRRTELGLTHVEVSEAGGPSTTTMTKIENDLVDGRISRLTLERIDDALRWSPGSAQRALQGGEAEPVPTVEGDSPADVLAGFPDRDLLRELERRLARRAEERDGDGNAAPTTNVTPIRTASAGALDPEMPDDLAARTTGAKTLGERVDEELAAASEEDQGRGVE